MNRIITQIHKVLIKTKKTVAVAESCTGGLLSNLLTQLSGSSRYFILGIVAYSNQAKENILKIPAGLISKKGAVSKEAACALAQSARKLGKTDFGIGITGIAGPAGGSVDKPAGTVFIAVSGKNKTRCEKFRFKASRIKVRKMAALKSLRLLIKLL